MLEQDSTYVQRLKAMRLRLDSLYRRSLEMSLSGEEQQLLPEAFKELCAAAEELHVVEEELQRQNEELMAAHRTVECQRRRHQELFEFSAEGQLVTDAFGTIQEANRAAALLLQVAPDQMLGTSLVCYIAPATRRSFRDELMQLHRQERSREWVVPMGSGKQPGFDVGLKVATMRDDEGRLTALRWVLRAHPERDHSLLELSRLEAWPVLTFVRGEPIPIVERHIYQVKQGLVKLSALHTSGEEVLVGIVRAQMPFGPALSALASYQATAMTNVVLVSIPQREIEAHPRLSQALLPSISRRLQQTEALLAIAGQQRAEDRLRSLLLLLKSEVGEPVQSGVRIGVRLTHEELASAIGTVRVTVTNLLRRLKQEGWLSLDTTQHIIVCDRASVRTQALRS